MSDRARRLLGLAAPLAAALSAALVAHPAPADAAPGPTNGLIAFSDDRDGNREIYTIAPDGTGLQRLTHAAGADTAPRWSPDGSQIAYLHDNQIWVMDADGSDAHQVHGYAADGQLSWSPDGSRIAYAANGAIGVVDSDGTDPRVVVPQVQPGYDLEAPDWSPDGTQIAYLRSTGPGAATIHAVRPDGTQDVEVSASYGHLPRWSPDGSLLAYAELGLTVQPLGGEPERVVFLNGSGEGTLRGLAWAPDQSALVYAQNRWDGATWTHPEIKTVNLDGTGVAPLTPGWTPDWQPVPPVVPDTEVGTGAGDWSLTQPSFGFGSSTPGATFECSLDGGPWTACASPYTPSWKAGDHALAVRAVAAGNADPTPETVRWRTPHDDRALRPRGTWTRVRTPAAYRGSLLSTTSKGAALVRKNVRASELALVATTCRSCGKVDVFLGRRLVARVSLRSAATRGQVVIPVGSWARPRPAASVRVVVTTQGRPVRIDGIGISTERIG